MSSRLRHWAAPIFAAAVTAAVFIPSLFGDFLDWDDKEILVSNHYYNGFSWASLRWIFGFHFAHYYPLTWLSFAADRALWGLNPFGFHLTNIILHAVNAALLCLIFIELLRRVHPGRPAESLFVPAALAALLFSVHPLRVESVAWISERSDVLTSFFYLLTVLFYLHRRLGAALGAYVLSLAAKTTGVMLPFTLLILDVYPLRRLSRRVLWPAVREKAPFFAAAAVAGLLTLISHSRMGVPWSLDNLGLIQRLVITIYGFAFYFYKTIWPINLLPLYPLPKPFSSLTDPFLASSALILILTASFWLLRRKRPEPLAAWAHYLLTLLPVSGLLKVGPQLAADRYTYLPSLGWAALAAGWLASRRRGVENRLALTCAVILISLLAGLTVVQCGIWKDSETFWAYHLHKDPTHVAAHIRLGSLKLDKGQTREAEALFRRALLLDPAAGGAHNNLGNLLASQGKNDEAVEHYRLAISADPQHPVVRHNLAMALAGQGRINDAIAVLEQELILSPNAEPTQELLKRLLAIRSRR